MKKCDKIHINECPDYDKEQKCPRGNKCPLMHRNKNKSLKSGAKEDLNSIDFRLREVNEEEDSDKSKFGDSFISFKTSNTELKPKIDIVTLKDEESLKTRPSFMSKKIQKI